jgi:hypothetical protein
VAVYVVVFAGEIVMLPDAAGSTVPMPLSMLMVVALVVDQISFALCPTLIALGLRERVTLGAVVERGPVVTVTVTCVVD